MWLVSLKFSGFHVIVGGGTLGVCNTSMHMYVICICVCTDVHCTYAVNSCPSVHISLVNQTYLECIT